MFDTRCEGLVFTESGKPDGSSLGMADVVELLVARLVEDVVDGGGEIVLSHVIPAVEKHGSRWSRWWIRLVQGGVDGGG